MCPAYSGIRTFAHMNSEYNGRVSFFYIITFEFVEIISARLEIMTFVM